MTPRAPEQRGFALLVLLSVIGSAAMAIVLAATAMLPVLSLRAGQTATNVETALLAARLGFLRNGAFPTTLTNAATAAGLDSLGTWRRDPYYAAVDLGYGMSGSSLRVRGRGPDLALGTADDVTYLLPTERHVRLRQRTRLRLLRAVLMASPFRTAPTMTTVERTAMRDAMRDYAIAQREWLGADPLTLAALASRMGTDTTMISTLVATHACTPLPATLTGAGGLASVLGMADTLFVDGLGQPLIAHASLGVVAQGSDLLGGTNDDM